MPGHVCPIYLQLANRKAGTVAGQDEQRKLTTTHHLIPVAVEIMGVLGPEAHIFLRARSPHPGGDGKAHILPLLVSMDYGGNAAAVLRWHHPSQQP